MSALIEAFCGDAHISFEGDLSKLQWSAQTPVHPRISVLLRRQTCWPTQDYVVLPVEVETVLEIKRSVLPVVGLKKRVAHVQIEKRRQLVFGAYDWFGLGPGCVWVVQSVGTELLDRLRREGSLKSYNASRYELDDKEIRTSPEQYLVDLLTEQDVSLEDAFRAFGGDREHARRVLDIYIGTGSVVLKDGDEVLPEWKVKELLRDPTLFDEHGRLFMTPSSTYDKARQQGQI